MELRCLEKWQRIVEHNDEWKKESEVAQSCPTLCDPVDCSLPGSSIHGIFQARVPEWLAISFSRGASRDGTCISCISGRCFTIWAPREAHSGGYIVQYEKWYKWKLCLLFLLKHQRHSLANLILPSFPVVPLLPYYIYWNRIAESSPYSGGGEFGSTPWRASKSWVRLWSFSYPAVCNSLQPHGLGFSRQEYRKELPFSFSRGERALTNPEIELTSLACVPCIVGRFLTTEPPGKPEELAAVS